MAAQGRGPATVIANNTGLEFSDGQNKALDLLKASMGKDAHMLDSLKIDRALVSPHNGDSQLCANTPISPLRIEIGKSNKFCLDLTIYAYLVKNHSQPDSMKVACYAFPHPGKRGRLFHPDDLYEGVGTLHESFRFVPTAGLLMTMLKLYFVYTGFELGSVQFRTEFVRRVKKLWHFWAESDSKSRGILEQTEGTWTQDVRMKLNEDGPAERHEESPGPSTTVLKRERHSTPPISRDDSIATLSDPNTTIHPAPRIRPKNPTHPPPTAPTPSKPTIDGTSLTTAFTLPLTTARATEKSLDRKILTKKRKLTENSDEIERLWGLIEVADKKKLKLEGKIKEYEGRREDAVRTQRELVEGMDPMLRRFIRVAREVGVGEEEEEMEEGGE